MHRGALALLEQLGKLPDPERRAACQGAGVALQLVGGALGRVGALLAAGAIPVRAPAAPAEPRRARRGRRPGR